LSRGEDTPNAPRAFADPPAYLISVCQTVATDKRNAL
jgi:hypothetical protein